MEDEALGAFKWSHWRAFKLWENAWEKKSRVQDPRRFNSIDFRHTLRAQNEFVDALATIASMIQHPERTYIDPLEIMLREEQAHCTYVEDEPDGRPWYTDIKAYLEKREYPLENSANQKKTIRRLANGFFLNKEVLYKKTPDLGLLRCVDAIAKRSACDGMQTPHDSICPC
ncbi:uncharacterized protein LOC132613049 [Lycium barbarum]|uniref:uncharacterized protein LOC132613049 n=1 Tax=Lycium barbarum TaxID=112863 RepID=UPI00293EBCC6|nr:uncharacterized protein LOC132613049 [Lycium barbarum]